MMTVKELIEQLKAMPQDAEVLNGKPTSLGTLTGIISVGTVKVLPVYGRLTRPEYREPINSRDEPALPRQIAVIVS